MKQAASLWYTLILLSGHFNHQELGWLNVRATVFPQHKSTNLLDIIQDSCDT